MAVAERLYERHSFATIAMVEQGSLLLRQHFYDSHGSMRDRDRFLELHRHCPWEGDLSRGGALLPCLGGRGIVGGSQLHRFYDSDFSLWANGLWGVRTAELSPYFDEAEERLLGGVRSASSSQDYAHSALAGFNARHPPYGPAAVAANGLNDGFPHRSSVQRILALLDRDRQATSRRLALFTNTVAVKLATRQPRREEITHVQCVRAGGSSGKSMTIHGAAFVLAASPVESARLVLVSGIGEADSSSSVVGRYLAEHIYCRGLLDVSGNPELNRGPINLFIPPPGDDLDDRFQVELRSTIHPDDSRALLRLTGSAAMDPRRENRLTLSPGRVDIYGVPRAMTVLTRSPDDERRTLAMLNAMDRVAAFLGGRWLTPPEILPCGASYHESGTLRIAGPEQESAAAADGLLFGTTNVFVGDGAAFASIGVANPILTLTAMGYRLGDRLAELISSA
ncbi:MAG TPA: GMC oxidoreductase [Candidatus Limnocylindrales bacterium]|nr:GMC oxidoreductase [Candidatus Limnocylindrales bacterium]